MKYKSILLSKNYLIPFLMALPLLSPGVQAQINFPNGNFLNLNTDNDFLYMETRLIFNTGIYKSDDYKWEKIYDSLDKNWLITACFNGECRNELADSGSFIRDYGLNDTTGFIAFHVETYKYDGLSRIRYKVYNKNDHSDQQDLIFNITYKNNTGISPGILPVQIKITNPVGNTISIMKVDLPIGDIFLYDALGKEVCSWSLSGIGEDIINLDLPQGLSGFYILRLTINGNFHQQKIIINQ